MSSKNNFLIYYITEDYHNLLYDHIYNHSKIDYEILDVISPELLGYNGVKSIDFCSECSSYKIKIANQYGYLIYADNQVQNVTFMDATVIAEPGGMLGDFKLSEGTYFHSDANTLLYGKGNLYQYLFDRNSDCFCLKISE